MQVRVTSYQHVPMQDQRKDMPLWLSNDGSCISPVNINLFAWLTVPILCCTTLSLHSHVPSASRGILRAPLVPFQEFVYLFACSCDFDHEALFSGAGPFLAS